MMLITWMQLLLAVLLFQISRCQQIAPRIDCSPQVDYVETDPGLHRYNPYITRIHRCRGASWKPSLKKCIPITSGNQNVEMLLFDTVRGGLQRVNFVNNTLCTSVCVVQESDCNQFQIYDDGACECRCRYTTQPDPNPCQAPFEWSNKYCNCTCPDRIKSQKCTNEKKRFSTEDCGCVCLNKYYKRCSKRKLVLDEQTCGCREPTVDPNAAASSGGCSGGVSGGVLAVVIIFEAVCFIGAYFLFYVYCYKRKYVPRKIERTRNKTESDGYQLPNGGKIHMFNTDTEPPKHVEIAEAVEKYNGAGKYVPPAYYPEEEKSPLTAKDNSNDEWYLYNDVTVTDSPRLMSEPDSYSLSEDGYASVTQV